MNSLTLNPEAKHTLIYETEEQSVVVRTQVVKYTARGVSLNNERQGGNGKQSQNSMWRIYEQVLMPSVVDGKYFHQPLNNTCDVHTRGCLE